MVVGFTRADSRQALSIRSEGGSVQGDYDYFYVSYGAYCTK